jgi:hypothetical protein
MLTQIPELRSTLAANLALHRADYLGEQPAARSILSVQD